MTNKSSQLVCRFHACDTLDWLYIRDLLQSLVINRIAQGSECVTVAVNSQAFDTICEFIRQMDTAYIHPRRDSFHVSLCSEMYADFRIPGSWQGKLPHVKKTEILPMQGVNENLSQTA